MVFLQFSSKNKWNVFHFHKELYWTTCSPFCSISSCHFSGNFIIPSSQNVLSFWAKNCSRCLLQSSRELKFSPLKEICKDQNKLKSKGVRSGEYGRWIRTSQQSSNCFCMVINKHVVLCYPEGSLYIFSWLIPDTFHWILLSVGLIRSSTSWNSLFDFLEGTRNRGLHFKPTIYTTSPSLDKDWPLMWLAMANHISCPMISSVPHDCIVSTFISRYNLF